MTDAVSQGPRKPGVVIFVAILQFFSSSLFFLLSLLAGLGIGFGAVWGWDSYVTQRIAQASQNPNFSYGLTWIFGTALVAFLALAVFFLTLGIGLLKGKKFAWYLQVALSVLGLLGLPFAMMASLFVLPLNAILNVVILILFFRPRVRDYFKV